jgi:hypothetical protein
MADNQPSQPVTLQQAVQKFANDLAAKVSDFADNIATLEVYTFTTTSKEIPTFPAKPKMTELSQDTKTSAALRAYTRIAFDGDMVVWLPVNDAGVVDKSVWDMHQAMVQQAMDNRKAMIQSVSEAASSALKALGVAK